MKFKWTFEFQQTCNRLQTKYNPLPPKKNEKFTSKWQPVIGYMFCVIGYHHGILSKYEAEPTRNGYTN